MNPLVKVNWIGYAYFHVFRFQDGSLGQKETTEKDYKQLATPKHRYPSYPGAKWQCSFECLKFDAPDGFLPDNCYAGVISKSGKSYQVIKLPGFEMQSLYRNEIDSNGILL